ncbi:MAG: hypothetical protein LBQ68_08805 [Clostridiales bacterium]|nr:hypothetical protein [Clostridiales bacterium]
MGTQEKKVLRSITTGLKSLKKYYLRVLLALIVLFSAGILSGLPFHFMQTTLVSNIIQAMVSALIGGLGIIGVVAIYPKSILVNPKKRLALDDISHQTERKQETKEPAAVCK